MPNSSTWFYCTLCKVLVIDKGLILHHVRRKHRRELRSFGLGPPAGLSDEELHPFMKDVTIHNVSVGVSSSDRAEADKLIVENVRKRLKVDIDLDREGYGFGSDGPCDEKYIKELFTVPKLEVEKNVSTRKPGTNSANPPGFWNKYHICYICQAPFDSKDELHNHRESHKGEKPYQCPKCVNLAYATETLLKYHMLTHLSNWEKLSKDPEALAKEKKKIKLDRRKYRMQLYKPPKTFQCPMCPEVFAYNCILRRHVMQHTKDRPHICGTCGTSYTSGHSLRLHIQENKCEKKFLESALRTYECDICSVRVKTEKILVGHKQRMHGVHKPRRAAEEYICLFCGYNAGSATVLTRHNRSHTGEKPFPCHAKNCGLSFSIRMNMVNHMRSHCAFAREEGIAEDIFKNPIKWRGTNRKSITRTYSDQNQIASMSLTGESAVKAPAPRKRVPLDQWITCDKCGEKCETPFRFRMHSRAHGTNFMCPLCPAGYAFKMGLSLHKSRMHNKEVKTKHQCHICKRFLANRSSLKQHYAGVHRIEMPDPRRSQSQILKSTCELLEKMDVDVDAFYDCDGEDGQNQADSYEEYDVFGTNEAGPAPLVDVDMVEDCGTQEFLEESDPDGWGQGTSSMSRNVDIQKFQLAHSNDDKGSDDGDDINDFVEIEVEVDNIDDIVGPEYVEVHVYEP